MVVYDLEKIGSQAAHAAFILSQLTTVQKNQALLALAQELREQAASIIAANETDLQASQKLPSKFLDRLRLTPERIEQMAVGIEQVAQLPDPIGAVTRGWVNHAGLQIVQKRVPLGVV